MRKLAPRRTIVAATLCTVALIAAGCSDDKNDDAAPRASSSTPSTPQSTVTSGASSTATTVAQSATEATAETAAATEVTLTGERDVEVTLTGPIAVKYGSASQAQKQALGKPLTGDHNAETRESGVVFQQFQGGVIVAKNDAPNTPAFIVTSGKIRDAWNTERGPDGAPLLTGKNGSAGPLGVPTSDLTTEGDLEVVTFEHGKITENAKTGAVTVTVNGKVVPSGLK